MKSEPESTDVAEFTPGMRRMLKDMDDGRGADSEDEIDDEAEGVGVLVAEKTTEQQMLDAIIDAGAQVLG